MINNYEDPNHGQRDGWLTCQETSWNESSSSIDTLDLVEWELEDEFRIIPKSLKISNVSLSFPLTFFSLCCVVESFHFGTGSIVNSSRVPFSSPSAAEVGGG